MCSFSKPTQHSAALALASAIVRLLQCMQQRDVVSTHLNSLAHDLLCLSIGVHLRIVVAALGCRFGLAIGKFQRDMSRQFARPKGV